MRRIATCATMVLASTAALAIGPTGHYRIKLTQNTGGLDIAVQTFSGPAATVRLENRSGKTALCSASFISYPHTPSSDETRQTVLAAGERATLAYPAKKLGGSFSTAFVSVNCSEKRVTR